LKAGILAYGLDRPIGGISRYTLELVRALADLENGPDVTLLAAGGAGALAGQNGLRSVPLPGCRLLPGLLTLGNAWLPLRACQLGLDLLHDPTGVTPLLLGAGPARSAVTVHDVFAWSCPGTSTLLDTMIYRYWLPRILPGVDAVITVSEHSRQDILRYLHVDPNRLNVIPYGVADRFRPMPSDEVKIHLRDRLGLSGPYILYVGALTQRKNVGGALEAFALIEKRFPRLQFVLAGPRTWNQTPVEDLVQRLEIAPKVALTGPLTDTDLPALYSGADLFVFPSLYEGFGLPPLEAMACGTPVVTSNTSSLPEVVGDAAITVDPYDVEALAEAMRRVLSDPDLAHDLRRRGLERAAGFTWEQTARKTVEVYREVLS